MRGNFCVRTSVSPRLKCWYRSTPWLAHFCRRSQLHCSHLHFLFISVIAISNFKSRLVNEGKLQTLLWVLRELLKTMQELHRHRSNFASVYGGRLTLLLITSRGEEIIKLLWYFSMYMEVYSTDVVNCVISQCSCKVSGFRVHFWQLGYAEKLCRISQG